MTVRLVIEIDAQRDMLATKEAVAMALEKFGAVKVLAVEEQKPEQMQIGGWNADVCGSGVYRV